MTSQTVWITGARGFIGRHLARQLHTSGKRVIGIGHGGWPDCLDWGVSGWLNGEITVANLNQLAHDHAYPESVFHLAGGSSVGAAIAAPREDFARTVETTASLCDWLRLESPETHLLAVSSAAVYGTGHNGPIPETAAGRPYSPYGFHKLMMEQVCRSYAETYGLHVVIARLFSVYGSGLQKQLLWDCCRRLGSGAKRLELGGTGREMRDWTDVRDVVRALECLVEKASITAPAINVGSGKGCDVGAIAHLLVEAWGGGAQVGFTGSSRPGDPVSLIADDTCLRALAFDWIVGVEDGIRDYVDWYKAHA